MHPDGDNEDDLSDIGDGESAKTGGGIDPSLLDILVCPITKGPLKYDAECSELISPQAGLAYPIRDGIPIMLADEARHLDDVELDS